MRYNSNFKYDLKVGMVAEKILAELLENKTIEVKKDLQAIKTGSIYIEYESRKKPSGLATTQADFYCYFITDGRMFLIETEELKELEDTAHLMIGQKFTKRYATMKKCPYVKK